MSDRDAHKLTMDSETLGKREEAKAEEHRSLEATGCCMVFLEHDGSQTEGLHHDRVENEAQHPLIGLLPTGAVEEVCWRICIVVPSPGQDHTTAKTPHISNNSRSRAGALSSWHPAYDETPVGPGRHPQPCAGKLWMAHRHVWNTRVIIDDVSKVRDTCFGQRVIRKLFGQGACATRK